MNGQQSRSGSRTVCSALRKNSRSHATREARSVDHPDREMEIIRVCGVCESRTRRVRRSVNSVNECIIIVGSRTVNGKRMKLPNIGLSNGVRVFTR